MAYEQFFLDDRGREVRPERDGWDAWVGASATRNAARDNHLLDWLELHGRAQGFQRDDELPGWDPRLDFGAFVMGQGIRFERCVMAELSRLAQVFVVRGEGDSSRDEEMCRATWDAMERGEEAIAQGVLRDPEHRVHGSPDLLVRADVLARLFAADGADDATGVGAGTWPWHYRAVDIKFSRLHLDRYGRAKPASHAAYAVQAWLYNRALGRIQGFEPPASYLLGRGWEQGKERGGDPRRGDTPFERLGRIEVHHEWGARRLGRAADEAVEWVRRARLEGASWSLLPAPTVPELYPNMGVDPQLWSTAVKQVAAELGEITLGWQAGIEARRAAHRAGVFRWDDPRCTADVMGITGATRSPVVDAILEANRTAGPAIASDLRLRRHEEWVVERPLEFFVDFETTSNLDDGFTALGHHQSDPRIFMVGCGHIENGQWRFAQFTADGLDGESERAMLDAWFEHMRAVTLRLAPGTKPTVFHWSPAEQSQLTTMYRAARERHRPHSLRWQEPAWFDLLREVVKKPGEPVIIRGAMAFGLKAIARALHGHGLIETSWGDSKIDGLGAMVGAWNAQQEATARGCRLIDIELVQEIGAYNEVDCRVMWETLGVLRAATRES